jgi:hypothetical protein
MLKKIFLVIAIFILMVLCFIGGGWIGNLKCGVVEEDGFSKLVKSSFVQSWTASIYGKITAISGRNISLALSEKTLSVPIKENAIISEVSFTGLMEGSTSKFETKDIRFEDLAIGQKVNIVADVAKDGAMQGVNVTVIKESSTK